MIDATGGFGVDSMYFSKEFKKTVSLVHIPIGDAYQDEVIAISGNKMPLSAAIQKVKGEDLMSEAFSK